MARHDDVSALLAAGREAVAHTQTYVSACQKVGYRNPELTGYGGQLIDRYDSEAGLDLRLLDSDCGALRGLADAADAAVRVQREQLTVLVGAWRGPGADAAADFLHRHCDAAAELASGIRAAATGCAELRDELWRLLDTKVTAALAVDDRVGAARPIWLAAAEAVGAGVAGDSAEIIEKQVIPYVDNDVRGEWVSAIRTARDGAVAAYDAAVAAAGSGSEVMFAMPAGHLIPRSGGPSLAVPEPVWRPPAADPVPGPAPLPAPDSTRHVVGSDSPVPSREDLSGGLAGPGGLVPPGDMGLPFGGLPGGGLGGLSSLGGLVPRLAEAFGGSGAGELPAQPLDVTDSPRGQTDADEDPTDPAEDPDETTSDSTDSEESDPTEEVGQGEPAAGADAAAVAQEAEVADTTEGLSEQVPVSADPPLTPCEIAAEELPQVGP